MQTSNRKARLAVAIYATAALLSVGLTFVLDSGGAFLSAALSAPWGMLTLLLSSWLPTPAAIVSALLGQALAYGINGWIVWKLFSRRTAQPTQLRNRAAKIAIGVYAAAMVAAIVVGFVYMGHGDGVPFSFLWVMMLAMPGAVVLIPLGPIAIPGGFACNCWIIWRVLAREPAFRHKEIAPKTSWWERETSRPIWPH